LLGVDSTRHEGEQRGVYRTVEVEVEVERCLEREEEDLCNECGGNIRYDKRKEKNQTTKSVAGVEFYNLGSWKRRKRV